VIIKYLPKGLKTLGVNWGGAAFSWFWALIKSNVLEFFFIGKYINYVFTKSKNKLVSLFVMFFSGWEITKVTFFGSIVAADPCNYMLRFRKPLVSLFFSYKNLLSRDMHKIQLKSAE
jgi:hypothetical protein